MAERRVPVEKTPVEPRTRRGRRKMDDVAAETARNAARTTNKANEAKTRAKTRTAILTEQEKQAAIKARKAAKEKADRKQRRADAWVDIKRRAGALARVVMIVGPIMAPMSIAWTGQIGFARKVLDWTFAGGVAYAGAYELVIVFFAWMYHEARKDGDSGVYYRVMTWVFAIGNGVQQWWHWADDWAATPRAVAYSTMTAIGILTWEGYAKLVHRRKLRKDGKLPPARSKIGLVRWIRYPRTSWTAWSGWVLHGFETFNDMWTWAETEREVKKANRDKTADLRRQLREAKARISDLESAKDPKVIKGKIERPAPDPEQPKAVDPEPNPEPKELEAGSPKPNPGDNGHVFEPTSAEIDAIKEMVEAEIRLNRENVMTYIRDEDNRTRLGQPEGIATKRAALLAAWGRANNDGLKAVGS